MHKWNFKAGGPKSSRLSTILSWTKEITSEIYLFSKCVLQLCLYLITVMLFSVKMRKKFCILNDYNKILWCSYTRHRIACDQKASHYVNWLLLFCIPLLHTYSIFYGNSLQTKCNGREKELVLWHPQRIEKLCTSLRPHYCVYPFLSF
jgi:hypothetical protein